MGDDAWRGHLLSARRVQVIKLVHRRWPGLAATWGPSAAVRLAGQFALPRQRHGDRDKRKDPAIQAADFVAEVDEVLRL